MLIFTLDWNWCRFYSYCLYFCAYIYLTLNHAVQDTLFSYLGCLSRTVISSFLLLVTVNVVILHLPIGHLKTSSGLEQVLRYELNTYQPISPWVSHCTIGDVTEEQPSGSQVRVTRPNWRVVDISGNDWAAARPSGHHSTHAGWVSGGHALCLARHCQGGKQFYNYLVTNLTIPVICNNLSESIFLDFLYSWDFLVVFVLDVLVFVYCMTFG